MSIDGLHRHKSSRAYSGEQIKSQASAAPAMEIRTDESIGPPMRSVAV